MENIVKITETELVPAHELKVGDYILEEIVLEHRETRFKLVNDNNVKTFIRDEQEPLYELLKVISVHLTEYEPDIDGYEIDYRQEVIVRGETRDSWIRSIRASTNDLFTVVKGM